MLRVRELRKDYATERGRIAAVRNVSFDVDRGEIYTLLGPSGCGKSTTLRCIAGLETPDTGEIQLGKQLVFSPDQGINLPIYLRGVGMVFQSYAIWPHMTVFENVAFPLRQGPFRAPRKAVRSKVMRALKLVQMEDMADRPAPLLSGGQQQRVALARAITYEPAVLLLDEPLSNLDAKLRLDMRSELQTLIKQLGVTALYVTHDQEEALVLSDRIAVMQNGIIEQEGSPREIYTHPVSTYVAGFVGRTNFFAATTAGHDPDGRMVVQCDFGRVTCSLSAATEPPKPGETRWLTIRPEEIITHSEPCDGLNVFSAAIVRTVFVGSRTQCELQIGKERCETEIEGRSTLQAGTRIYIELPADRVRLLH